MKTPMLLPVHPGEVLLKEFLEPLGITQYLLAQEIHVPARRINEIIHGNRKISADTALRLGKYFSTSAAFWLNLQTKYDLDLESERIGTEIEDGIRAFEYND